MVLKKHSHTGYATRTEGQAFYSKRESPSERAYEVKRIVGGHDITRKEILKSTEGTDYKSAIEKVEYALRKKHDAEKNKNSQEEDNAVFISMLAILGGVSGVWMVSQAISASVTPTAQATGVAGLAGMLAFLTAGAIAGGLAVYHHYNK